jgi:hypothetical protein
MNFLRLMKLINYILDCSKERAKNIPSGRGNYNRMGTEKKITNIVKTALITLSNALDDLDYKYNSFFLKKLAQNEIDFRILKAHGLSSESGEYKKLGEGSEGTVYLAEYKGHPVAVKITYNGSALEGRKWDDILGSKMPEDLEKHLPKIYTCWPKQCGDGAIMPDPTEADLPNHQIIVMEVLAPLEGESLDALFPDLEREHGYQERLTELIQDSNLLGPTIDYAINSAGLDASEAAKVSTFLSNFMRGYNPGIQADNEALERKVREDIFNAILPQISDETEDELGSMLDGFFGGSSGGKEVKADAIAESFVNYTIQRQFPYGYNMWDSRKDFEYFKHHPKTKGLLSALLHIANNTGIGWADVKPQNLMIRPTTGDIVIVDVGRYGKIA